MHIILRCGNKSFAGPVGEEKIRQACAVIGSRVGDFLRNRLRTQKGEPQVLVEGQACIRQTGNENCIIVFVHGTSKGYGQDPESMLGYIERSTQDAFGKEYRIQVLPMDEFPR